MPSVSPSDCPASTVRTSSPGMRPSRSISAARAASVCCWRSPKFWLGLLSTTTAATEVSGSRSSRVKEGFASASTISNSAMVRTDGAAAAREQQQRRDDQRNGQARPDDIGGTSGAKAMPKFMRYCPSRSSSAGHVHLIGLVVAGQRVHHDVDAGAEGEFALARFARRHRQHGLPVRPHRPGAGEIVRGDDDRGDAVARAGRAVALILIGGGQRFDPQAARVEAAGEVAQQEEGLGQHVIAGDRLELRECRATTESRAAPSCPDRATRRPVRAALRWRRGCRTARCRLASCRRRAAPAPAAKASARRQRSASRSAGRRRGRRARCPVPSARRLRARCAGTRNSVRPSSPMRLMRSTSASPVMT